VALVPVMPSRVTALAMVSGMRGWWRRSRFVGIDRGVGHPMVFVVLHLVPSGDPRIGVADTP